MSVADLSHRAERTGTEGEQPGQPRLATLVRERRTDVGHQCGDRCSLARSLEIVGDWWSPLIIRDLFLGLARFDQLVADLGISRNLLTERLATLIAGGVVIRHPYQDKPLRYHYELTAAGHERVPVLLALTAWGDSWTADADGPPMRFRHGPGGHRCTPTVSCSACREPLTSHDVTVTPGPGGRAGPGTALVARVAAGRP